MDLQSLILKRKSHLKPCKTIVTNESGERFEIINGEKTNLARVLPFVVDNKPDFQVGCVLPGLFLGSQDVATNMDVLQEHQIRHILSIGINPSIKFDHITYHYCELLDLPESNILEILSKCIAIINDCRRENIFVHCNAGVSRSPAIVISYLIVINKMTYAEAYEQVKSVRNAIKPNEGFVKQLKTLEGCSRI